MCYEMLRNPVLTRALGWQVADRGYYQLKPEYWEEFDPLFAHYYLNELEDAEVCGVFFFIYLLN
jgi:hypothetical protein